MGLAEATYEKLAATYVETPILGELAGRFQYGLGQHQVAPLDKYIVPASLIRRTRVLGSASAAVSELQGLIETDTATAELVAILAGVSVENSIDLAPDMQLIPYGRTMLPGWMRSIEGAGHRLMDRRFADVPFAAAVVKRVSFSPVFGDDSQPAANGPVEHIAEVTALAMVIALSTTATIGIARMYWGDADPRLPFVTEPVAYGDPQWIEGSVDQPTAIDEAALRKVVNLYLNFTGAKDGIDLIIKRLNRSRRMWREEDRAIEIGIALEALLMHGDKTKNQEITFKLGLRAAWLLGNSLEGRLTIVEQVRDLYGLRSTAVHQGKLSRTNDVLAREMCLSNGADLVRRLLLTILERGQWPDWRALVLGG